MKILSQMLRIKNLPLDEPIVVYGIEWLEKLVELISRYTQTQEGKELVVFSTYCTFPIVVLRNLWFRIVDDYVKWFAILQMLPYVDRNVFNMTYLPALNFLSGLYGEPPRWIECITKIEYLLSFPVSKMLVRIRNDSRVKPEVILQDAW